MSDDVAMRDRAAIDDEAGWDVMPPLARERRLHARAYDHWISLLRGRRCPALGDLDPGDLIDYAATSMLVELARGDAAPVVHFLGRALAAEASIPTEQPTIGDVPRDSVLGQLIRRLPAVRDHAWPVDLRADYPGAAGAATLYRGILLPFADDTGDIAYVYGVISWRRMAGAEIGVDIVAAVGSAMACLPGEPAASAWSAPIGMAQAPVVVPLPIAAQLAAARTWAALAAAEGGAPRPERLHAALSATHDLLIAAGDGPEGLPALAANEGLTSIGMAASAHGRPAGLAVRLVFGEQASRADRARFAAVLAHARRIGIGHGMLARTLDRYRGGMEAFAAAEHRARRLARGGVPVRAPSPRIGLTPLDEGSFGLLRRDIAPRARPNAGMPAPMGRRIVAG